MADLQARIDGLSPQKRKAFELLLAATFASHAALTGGCRTIARPALALYLVVLTAVLLVRIPDLDRAVPLAKILPPHSARSSSRPAAVPAQSAAAISVGYTIPGHRA